MHEALAECMNEDCLYHECKIWQRQRAQISDSIAKYEQISSKKRICFLFLFFCLSILSCPTLTYLPVRGLAPGDLHQNINFYTYRIKSLRLVRCEREPMIIVSNVIYVESYIVI